jgi:hypothetical protein
MEKETHSITTITVIGYIAASIGISVSVTVWLLSLHADGIHEKAITGREYVEFRNHERVWRQSVNESLRDIYNEIQNIKLSMNKEAADRLKERSYRENYFPGGGSHPKYPIE